MAKKNKFKFSGFDWTELAEYFGLKEYKEGESYDDGKCLEALKKYIQEEILSYIMKDSYEEYMRDCSKSKRKKVLKDYKALRAYLKSMLNDPMIGYDEPVWKGMLEIKGKETFCHFYIRLLDFMWT